MGSCPTPAAPGKYRGGLSIVREFEMLADDAVLNVRSDKRKFPPHGLFGGKPGTPSLNYLTHKGKDRLLPALLMETEPMMKGDRFRAILAGGGGYGDPFERDPELVRTRRDGGEDHDRIRAGSSYGVVIKPGPQFALDLAATEKAARRHRKRKLQRRCGVAAMRLRTAIYV